LSELRYTLLPDGNSDRCLLPILTWTLQEQGVLAAIQPEWADLGRLRDPPRGLVDRILASLELYPCDLLFVHRDAESVQFETRKKEIERALLEAAAPPTVLPPAVCVVPVRMQEAWLLIDERAIRTAAGNPRGTQEITLPPIGQIEGLPYPKDVLHESLRAASGLSPRRRKKFDVRAAARRVTEITTDFSKLRQLSAFRALEVEVRELVQQQHWQ
jgi:hypothetical protein